MTAYTFAYGVDNLLLWRRDGTIPLPGALAMAQTMKAMSDPDLQQQSKPVSDGVGLIYSMDSVYLADAHTGSVEPYLEMFQSSLLLLGRLQCLFDCLYDGNLEKGIPSHIKVLVASGAACLSDAAMAEIRRFVSDGGKLVASKDIGAYNIDGRSRKQKDRAWLKKSPNVLMLKSNDLRQWRHTLNPNDHRPRMCGDKPVPEFASSLRKLLEQHAPRKSCRKRGKPIPAAFTWCVSCSVSVQSQACQLFAWCNAFNEFAF